MKLRYFYLSLFVHVSIFFLAGLVILPKDVSFENNAVIKANIYQEKIVEIKQQPLLNFSPKIADKQIQKKCKDCISLKKNIEHNHEVEMPRISKKTVQPEQSKWGSKNELLKILHHQIAEKQQYPENALLLNQSGAVAIQFILYPNGDLQEIKLLKSSGFTALDQAALLAVNGIAPFSQAHLYLKQPETFSVTVIFAA